MKVSNNSKFNNSLNLRQILSETNSIPVICERTLKLVLENIIQNYPTKNNVIFTDRSGGSDDRIANVTDIINQTQNAKAFLKVQEDREIVGIIDDCESAKKWQEKLKSSLFVLNSTELELLYPHYLVATFLKQNNLPSWQLSTQPSFSKNYLKTKINNLTLKQLYPDLKVNLAKFVGQNVDKDFIKKLAFGLYKFIYV
jgi:hypothetical protein